MKRKGKAVKLVNTVRGEVSLLMRLPPEIHGIIADNVSTSQVQHWVIPYISDCDDNTCALNAPSEISYFADNT